MQKNQETKLVDVVKFINWHDIVYVAIVQLLLRFGFIGLFDFKTLFSDKLFFLLFFSVSFITISGYLINSFYKFKQQNFLISSMVFLVIGLLPAVFVSYKVQKPENSLIFFGFALVVLLVSKNLVNRSFIKTIAISMLMSFSLLIHWWFNSPIDLQQDRLQLFLKLETIIILFSLFLFSGNLIRAMVYSLRSRKKDLTKNKETFPIVFGVKKTKEVIFIISIITTIIVFFGVFTYASKKATYIVILPVHTITQIYILLELKKARTTEDYNKLLKKLDRILFLSMIYIPIIGFLIKSSVNS